MTFQNYGDDEDQPGDKGGTQNAGRQGPGGGEEND